MTRSTRLALLLAAVSVLAACEREPKSAEAPATPAAETLQPPAATTTQPQAKAVSERAYSRSYDACMASGDAAKGMTYAMQDCLVEEMKVADERLNTVYQRVMKGLDEAGREELRQAERGWIVVRDSTCQANLTGGTIDRLNVPACRLDATIARTKELEAMLPPR